MVRLAIAAALLVAAPALAHDRVSTDVTYAREVVRIVGDHCLSCHGATDAIPLDTYAHVRPWAKAIRDQVESGRMPPWPPTRGVGDLVGELAPRAAEILIAWAEGGAPEGDAAELPTVGDGVAARAAPKEPERDIAASRAVPFTARVSTTLYAVRPQARANASVELRAILPSGAQRPLVWIRRFDPRWARSYRLRAPLALPAGSRVVVLGDASARGTLTVSAEARAPAP